MSSALSTPRFLNGPATGSLPRAPLTPLIGRERELAELREYLRDGRTRLLTLTGAGGSGKTRLAQQLAFDLHDAFEDGTRFVSLAAVTEPALVPQTIVQELGVREGADVPLAELLVLQLRERELLLVLDNFEQVGDAAPAVATLLRECPRLAIVVTSRVPLHLSGEQEYPVPPLALPGAHRSLPVEELARCASIALFVERARAVDPSFVLDAGNVRAVSDICLRLDGLPLAIELAAARMKVLSPEALLARLSNRLRVLIGGARDAPARQRTLRDTIAWSYELLDTPEQALFRRLAVFAGGFTLDAAEAVAGDAGDVDALDGVTSLVDKSLLHRNGPDTSTVMPRAGTAPRFLMLETIREYALEQLAAAGEDAAARAAHTAWCLELAERGGDGLVSREQPQWLSLLETEHDNLRSAMTWTLEHGERALLSRFTAALWFFWSMRGYYSEALSWLTQAVAGDDTPSPARAQSLGAAGTFAMVLGNRDAAERWIDEGVRVAQLTGDQLTIGIALFSNGELNEEVGDMTLAVQLYLQAAEVFRAAGSPVWLAIALANGGATAVSLRRYDEATPMLDEALAVSREHGYEFGIGMCTANLGRIAIARNDLPAALAHLQNSLPIWRGLGDDLRVTRLVQRLATVAAAARQPVPAARWMACVEQQLGPFGFGPTAGATQAFEQAMALIRPQLSADELATAWDAGRALPLEQAIDEALALSLAAAPTPAHVAPAASERPLLSTREQEVLQLLVAGHSDRQIAETLFISHRTAQGHVANIFNKLGVSSRTAAATTALRDGLVPAPD